MIIAREFTKSDEEQVTNLVDEIRAYDGNFEGMGSSAVAYAWFVWEKGFNGKPIIDWIKR